MSALFEELYADLHDNWSLFREEKPRNLRREPLEFDNKREDLTNINWNFLREIRKQFR